MDSPVSDQIPIRTVPQRSVPYALSAARSADQSVDGADIYVLTVRNHGYRQTFAPPVLSEHTIAFHIEGKCFLEGKVGTLSGTFFHASPGTGMALVPAGVNSEWCLHGDDTFSAIFLSPSAIATLACGTLDIDASRIELIPSLFFSDDLLFNLGLAITAAFEGKDRLDLLYLESLSQTMAMHLVRHYSCAPSARFSLRGRLSSRSLNRIAEYIADQPLEHLKIRHLAGLLNLSPYHFERLFKATVGKSVHQYVLEQQLKKSLDLLRKSELTIAQISAELGFADQPHFDRCFKAFYGFAPGELRKK